MIMAQLPGRFAVFLAAFTMLIAGGPALANSRLEAARDLMEENRFDAAMEALLPLAASGNAGIHPS